MTATTALSRSAVYALMAESRFPKPIRIGSRAVRWVEREVLDFIASRPWAGSGRLRAAEDELRLCVHNELAHGA
ncbi:MAG: AlpA family phage regulatory protein [Acidobacteria bacterium]|nr:AlpA family phage regulatory protein [Acidobacteriota bacterium]